MRSLIVEDEFTGRMQLKYFLEEFGACDIAVNGSEALQAVELALTAKRPYDLICLDINMPGMNGLEVLSAIRDAERGRGVGTGKGVKVFMTTGQVDAKTIMKSFGGLCDEFVPKPVDPEALKGLLIKHSLK